KPYCSKLSVRFFFWFSPCSVSVMFQFFLCLLASFENQQQKTIHSNIKFIVLFFGLKTALKAAFSLHLLPAEAALFFSIFLLLYLHQLARLFVVRCLRTLSPKYYFSLNKYICRLFTVATKFFI